ncbi:hypothetical protein V1524DRAFT_411936, partial [Lipomyces starkeyi]
CHAETPKFRITEDIQQYIKAQQLFPPRQIYQNLIQLADSPQFAKTDLHTITRQQVYNVWLSLTKREWERDRTDDFRSAQLPVGEHSGFQLIEGLQEPGPPNELVLFEVNEIAAALSANTSKNPLAIFISSRPVSGNRHRLFICVFLGFIIQWSGNELVSYYLVVLLNSIGITNPKTQNIINGILQIFNSFTAIATAVAIDRIGRRTLFLASTFGMAVVFIIWTANSAVNQENNFENWESELW